MEDQESDFRSHQTHSSLLLVTITKPLYTTHTIPSLCVCNIYKREEDRQRKESHISETYLWENHVSKTFSLPHTRIMRKKKKGNGEKKNTEKKKFFLIKKKGARSR